MKTPPPAKAPKAITYVPRKQMLIVCRPCGHRQVAILWESRDFSYGVCSCPETLYVLDKKSGEVSVIRPDFYRPAEDAAPSALRRP
jgi:hypothetical protein